VGMAETDGLEMDVHFYVHASSVLSYKLPWLCPISDL
jgi:hypothetical protein